jgi:transposase
VARYLEVAKIQQVLALLDLGWSYRRIQKETGVRRETVARYEAARRSKPAKVFPGSDGLAGGAGGVLPGEGESKPAKVFPGSGSNAAKVFPGSTGRCRSAAAPYGEAIAAGLKDGLTVQRIWQDLGEEHGYPFSYESVKRFVRRLPKRERVVGVYHHTAGEEAQVDFFQGAPALHPGTGQWARPWVFRMTLCCSRHGYEEAVWDQKVETFLGLHERAFRDFGGVPRVVRHDYVPGHIIVVLLPPALCGARAGGCGREGRAPHRWAHKNQREASQSSSEASVRQTGRRGNPAEDSGGSQARSAPSFTRVVISA